MSQYEAVRLFIARAQAVKPDFTVTASNAPAVAEICFRLDGLPLAIELAAALVKMLPPQALLKRLEQRLPLLTGGARTLPARQQTMRNAIAWGHDLLAPDEQTLFRRLAVFPGGCTIEAAEAVASPDGTLDVFAGLASLVDKSLLRQDEGADGEPRFRMLETVREFGLERLEASGEETACRRPPRRVLPRSGRTRRSRPRREQRLRPGWTVSIREYDNMRRGARVVAGGLVDHDTLLRLVGALAFFWYYRGYLNEGRRWLDQALQTPPDEASPRPRAWALTGAGCSPT